MDIKKITSNIFDWVKIIIIALIFALIIRFFILSSTMVSGSSMNPTLSNNDKLLINRFFLFKKNLKKGDIVEFESPVEMNKDYIKRIIAIPGDKVKIESGKVFVNDIELKEEYISGDKTENFKNNEWILEKDEFFVMGDNRNPGKSYDSREFGPIKREIVVGIAFFRFSPITRIGILK